MSQSDEMAVSQRSLNAKKEHLMGLFLDGSDQPQANHPNGLAEGHPPLQPIVIICDKPVYACSDFLSAILDMKLPSVYAQVLQSGILKVRVGPGSTQIG
eukprot:1144427-Pelagomonas_calceolata.AAC.3